MVKAGSLVRLIRILSTHTELREGGVMGQLLTDLEVGESVVIIADPIDWEKSFRQVVTSPIVKFIDEKVFETRNSIYKIEEVTKDEIEQKRKDRESARQAQERGDFQ